MFRCRKNEKEVFLDTPDQLKLFDEAEKEADRQALTGGRVEVAAHRRKMKCTHEELAKNLPVEEYFTRLFQSRPGTLLMTW